MKRILAKATALLSAISIGTFGFSPVITQAATQYRYFVKSMYICGDCKGFTNYDDAKEYCKTRGSGFGVVKDDAARGAVLYVHGDINGDGKIGQVDLTLLKRCLASTIELTPEQEEKADIDNNGVINTRDFTILKQFYMSYCFI